MSAPQNADDLAGLPTERELRGKRHKRGVVAPSPVTLHVIDIPPLVDGDAYMPGVYVVSGLAGRDSAQGSHSIHRKIAGASGQLVSVGPGGDACCHGRLQETGQVRSPAGWAWDNVTELFVEIIAGSQPVSLSDAEVLAGYNWAMVGTEVLGFVNAELQSADFGGRQVFKLSRLLRGMMGTELRAFEHTGGSARFVPINAVDGRLRLVAHATSDVGQTFDFRAVSPGTDPDNAPSVLHTADLRTVRPMPVAGFRVDRRPNGAVRVRWRRRSRIRYRLFSMAPCPKIEPRLIYRIWLDDADTGERIATETLTEGAEFPSGSELSEWQFDNVRQKVLDVFGRRIALSMCQVSDTVGDGMPTQKITVEIDPVLMTRYVPRTEDQLAVAFSLNGLGAVFDMTATAWSPGTPGSFQVRNDTANYWVVEQIQIVLVMNADQGAWSGYGQSGVGSGLTNGIQFGRRLIADDSLVGQQLTIRTNEDLSILAEGQTGSFEGGGKAGTETLMRVLAGFADTPNVIEPGQYAEILVQDDLSTFVGNEQYATCFYHILKPDDFARWYTLTDSS